jgi:O-antigen/teichoic acid export membrane protein
MNNQPSKQAYKLNWKQLLAYLRRPFYKNSLFLIMDYGMTAGIGFFFWILVARFYSPVDVGYGSAAISSLSLLSVLGLIGFNYTLIRFLPGADKPAEMINTCLTLSGLISIVLAAVFLLGLNIWSPALIFIKRDLIFSVAFVVFAVAYTFSIIINNVYIASRRADLVVTVDTIQSVLKIPLAVSLVLYFRSFGIAAACGIAAAVSVLLGLFFILPRALKPYKPLPAFKTEILSHLWHYSAGSYLASLLIAVPGWIMPIMVVNVLDSEQNAYFYIVWTISSLLNAIAVAASQSLFVEGSHSDENLGVNIRKALQFIYLLLIPVAILVILFGAHLLSLFGAAYSAHGLGLLRIMAVASLFGGMNSIYSSTLRIKNKIRELYCIYAIQMVIVVAGSYLILPVTGTIGIGYLWLGAQVLFSLYVGLNLRKYAGGRR